MKNGQFLNQKRVFEEFKIRKRRLNYELKKEKNLKQFRKWKLKKARNVKLNLDKINLQA